MTTFEGFSSAPSDKLRNGGEVPQKNAFFDTISELERSIATISPEKISSAFELDEISFPATLTLPDSLARYYEVGAPMSACIYMEASSQAAATPPLSADILVATGNGNSRLFTISPNQTTKVLEMRSENTTLEAQEADVKRMLLSLILPAHVHHLLETERLTSDETPDLNLLSTQTLLLASEALHRRAAFASETREYLLPATTSEEVSRLSATTSTFENQLTFSGSENYTTNQGTNELDFSTSIKHIPHLDIIGEIETEAAITRDGKTLEYSPHGDQAVIEIAIRRMQELLTKI